jgi:hypothetical protein
MRGAEPMARSSPPSPSQPASGDIRIDIGRIQIDLPRGRPQARPRPAPPPLQGKPRGGPDG